MSDAFWIRLKEVAPVRADAAQLTVEISLSGLERSYARALTRNRDRADDLVQDTVGRALVKEQLWQPGTNLRAWLFTIMHNQNVNDVRRDIRDSAGLDIEQIPPTLTATTDPTATRKMFELERALAQLPLEQQQVILLVGLEGRVPSTRSRAPLSASGSQRTLCWREMDSNHRYPEDPPQR